MITPVGSEFRVNSYTNGDQRWSRVSSLTDGGFVAIWMSKGQNTNYGIYGQRYDANGQAVGSEFKINTNAYATQQGWWAGPGVSGLANGGFIVTWNADYLGNQSSPTSWDVYGQRYDVNGQAVGNEFRINTYTSSIQYTPAVAGLPNGGFITTWESVGQDGSFISIYGQRYDAQGQAVGEEFKVNTYSAGQQIKSKISVLEDGGFVVTWHSEQQDGSDWGIYGQRYDANAQPVGSEFQVNTYTAGWQINSRVTGLTDGGFVVTWDSNQDGSAHGIYGQRYNTNGQRVGSEFRVNTYTDNYQIQSSVVGLEDGGFLVTWESSGQDGSGVGVYGQRYDAAGQPVDAEFRINTYTDNSQFEPSVTALENGKVVVTWSSGGQDGSDNGVYGQLFSLGNASELSFTQANFSGNEGTGTGTVNKVIATIERSGDTSEAVSVPVLLEGGTATAPSDYTNILPLNVYFAPRENLKNVVIPIRRDNLEEADETIGLSLGNPTNGASLGSQTNATYTIVNDDFPPPIVSISISDAVKGVEGKDAKAMFTISLDQPSASAVNVSFSTADDTAQAGSDYRLTTRSIRFAPGQTAQTIAVKINNNDLIEADESFNVNLSHASANASIGDGQGTAVISDTLQATVSTTLPKLVENLTLLGNDPVNGTGNNKANALTGNSGDNTLAGMSGDDIILGKSGSDRLLGMAGNDLITGAEGADQFVFTANSPFSAKNFGLDIIHDFDRQEGDKIILDQTAFTALTSLTNQVAVVSNEAQVAGSLAKIVFNSSTGDLFYNQNGAANGLGTGAKFASLDGVSTVSTNDFVLEVLNT